jgi:hypothetical protein
MAFFKQKNFQVIQNIDHNIGFSIETPMFRAKIVENSLKQRP